MDNKSCSTEAGSCSIEKKCCPKKLAFLTIAAFAIVFAYDWLVHGNILMDTYKATASLWRPEDEMKAMMQFCFLKHALEALVFSFLFLRWKCTQTFGAMFTSLCPVRKGFYFGFGIGLLMGINSAAAYIYMPIPQSLAVSWLIAETFKWALVGGVLSLLCARCSKA